MALAVRSMWDPFSSLIRQLDTDFDNLVRRSFGAGQGASFVPAADVVRDGEDVVVTLELPGVDVDKDVNVEVAEGRLLITGQRAEQTSKEEGGVLIRESRSGSFRREFALPEHVTADDIAADYDRGLLKIRIRGVSKPKVEPRKIQVRSLGGSTPAQVEGDVENK
ncbi:MAG TPA: Hsp20/alpha crystallin family protein [Actinophytocola sp.]|uniref:Hsp20/alpha crystallin family protein n=1 Tax=Actinophytocola sp. TaxID=1872138 RepID=UPI002DDCD69D|nr:Hsp20/alpha crystallin family protein [Actinophytocola sp.]HEV2781811.1 Hsp20/alpha crystallin family protein [Actinophytocola sp.]